MKKFMSFLVAICIGMGFCINTKAEGPAKPPKWTIVAKDITNLPYFLLKYNRKEVAHLTFSLQDTAPSLEISKNIIKWFVMYFMPSDKDVDNMQEGLETWPMKTRHGPAIVRGWHGGAGHGKAFPTLLMVKFEKLKNWKSIGEKELEALKITLANQKNKARMTDFNDSDTLARSPAAKLCQKNCFNFD
jgi:hypothetical protein